MKILSSMPSQAVLNVIMEPVYKDGPVPCPSAPENHLGPVEIKRFIRELRKSRKIHYMRDFMY